VELLDDQVLLRPESVRAGSRPIRFDVQNEVSTPHQFLVIAIDKPAGGILVKDGVAQFFSEPGKETMIFYDGQASEGFSMMGARPYPPLGPPMEPGERRQVLMGYPAAKYGKVIYG
jgi:hypothetical protein